MWWVLIFLIIIYFGIYSMMRVAKESDERAERMNNTYKEKMIKR